MLLTGALLAAGLLATPRTGVAYADTAPPGTLPPTVSSDPLPTAQIDGVVWTQLIVGNTVYVGGNFTKARPAGAPLGSQEVTRTNLLAYNLTTGVLVTTFAPNPNAQVRALAASPDGHTLYVGGSFTTIAGQTRNRVASFDITTATPTLRPGLSPNVNYNVYGLAATSSTLYLGGAFSAIGSATRTGVAAVDAVTGAVKPFAADIPGPTGTVRQVIVSPDGSKVVIGGSFDFVNGSTNPGYGLALLDAVSGASLPMPVNDLIRDARTNSAIYSLQATPALGTTPAGFIGSGYAFSKTDGNLEGVFKSDWNGNLTWVEDCHGDSYSAFQAGQAVYVAGHVHYCGNVGGFFQTAPDWEFHRAIAFSTDARGLISRDPYQYFNYAGKPHPDLLTWFPDINVGTFTGQSQGPWNISGNSQYVLYGGEFTRVNNVAQQGLVRFAVTSIAPNRDGPRLSGANYLPQAQFFSQSVRLSWRANWDRDNELLSYALIRDGANSTPVFTRDVRSTFWQIPIISYLDTAVSAGQTHTYRLRVTDPKGNMTWGDPITVNVTTGPSVSSYDRTVLADGPLHYWPMNDTSGTTVSDLGLTDTTTRYAGTTQGVAGAIPGDPGKAYRFSGTNTGYFATNTALRDAQLFSVEAWFKTTSIKGGKIMGWGNKNTTLSGLFDRQIYLSNSGRVYFGTNVGGAQTINTNPGFNNGQWHHAVGTLSRTGMRLYVDGQLIGTRTDIMSAQIYDGYWRVGGDNMGSSWPGLPTSGFLAGDIDNAAVYPVELTGTQIGNHYQTGTGSTTNVAPNASFSSSPAGLTVSFNGSASSDSDGSITGYAWDFGDGSHGTGATASHTYSAGGTFDVTLTVTDDGGATGSTTVPVSVTQPSADDPFAFDPFNRTLASGLGNADTGGAWTVSAASGFSVGSGVGVWKLSAPGTTRTAYLGSTLSESTDLQINFSSDKLATSSGIFTQVIGRRIDFTTDYRTFVKLTSANAVQVTLQALQGSTTATALGSTVTLPGTYTANTVVHVRMQTFGSSPTTVRAKVWLGGAAEPASWTVTGTNLYAGLQAPGSVGFYGYVASGATNTPVNLSVLDLTAKPVT